ncbi:MAG: hypothetical protein EOL95_08495 [Bacteroidia bacterium]|nr:hypothetical protein [Bacteroidia bacterium]
MSLEEKFILLSARLHIPEDVKKELQNLSALALQWDRIFALAEIHKVDNLIYYALKQANLLNLIPDKYLQLFRLKYYSTAMNNEKFMNDINDIKSSLPEDKVVLLKGSALLFNLYPNYGTRQMGDIDILISKDRRDAVREQLLKSGWKSDFYAGYRSSIHRELAEKYSKTMYAVYKGKWERFLDIHWKFYIGKDDDKLAFEAMSTSVVVSGGYNVLSNEMMLIHLCSNFADGFAVGETLRTLCDIREFVHAKLIDWNKIEKVSKDTHLYEKTALSFNAVKWLYGDEVPESYKRNYFDSIPPSLDTLIISKKRKPKPTFWQTIKNSITTFHNPIKVCLFLYKTIFPDVEWLRRMYPGNKSSHIRYWKYLIFRHILHEDKYYRNF